MGFKCDSCSTEDAKIFCFTDNAVLCRECDARTHTGNKLSKSHERVTLQADTESATCDICQEHKAVMLCSEDRALTCRRCDLMIHTANDLVAKHHRYLLSGSLGLRAIEGATVADVEEGKSHKGYSLRNNAAGAKDKQIWDGSAEQGPWRSNPVDPGAAGLSSGNGFGSQPSLIDVRNPTLGGGMPEATPVTTPFGCQDEQFRAGSPPQQPGMGGQDASSSAIFQGWGTDILGGGLRPHSSDFTLAAELLGMPSVSQGFSAKDIDAAYIFDDNQDLDASLSALLEVPDLASLQGSSPPTLINQDDGLKTGGQLGQKRGSPSDGVVPDLQQSSLQKRQRF